MKLTLALVLLASATGTSSCAASDAIGQDRPDESTEAPEQAEEARPTRRSASFEEPPTPPVVLTEGGLVRGGNHAPEGTIDEVNHVFESAFMGWPAQSYELDPRPRFANEIAEDTRFDCPRDETVRYQGTTIRFRPTIRVHSAMIPRLQRFEELLAELGEARFGRAPTVIHHRGGYNCRNARGRRARISEHAYGNALDLQAIEFPALPREARRESELPRHLQRGFRATVLSDWNSQRRRVQMQRSFLHELTDTLRGRPDIFRGIVGPPRPRHHDHLHLDVAPWRYALYAYDE